MHATEERLRLNSEVQARGYQISYRAGNVELYPQGEERVEALLKRADAVMYERKRELRGRGSSRLRKMGTAQRLSQDILAFFPGKQSRKSDPHAGNWRSHERAARVYSRAHLVAKSLNYGC
jgi:hypothetical protein